ncbi:hypothetical protein DACRYDRAFT_119861 [Dacryopinax primogenitus]|uniref:Uncharacterized protein n=1 Tax=Dacryopinax primogenitus (strain DJM 731) TaxID=1858805 RepID=M5FU88_DACPD|nr:uncharacterized protein DACRYDRAFT_119861 [Dacryopinax primogenitus]EJT96796.1 hypothetical protein DACRYDRAFT_119861 [Dacryopinax primogenitus]
MQMYNEEVASQVTKQSVESPPRKWMKGDGENAVVLLQDESSSPGAGSNTFGTQSRTKGGVLDTTLEVDIGGSDDDEAGRSKHGETSNSVESCASPRWIPHEYSCFLQDLHSTDAIATVIPLDDSHIVTLTTNAFARMYRYDTSSQQWLMHTSQCLHPDATILDAGAPIVFRDNLGARVMVPYSLDEGQSTYETTTHIVELLQSGDHVQIGHVCASSNAPIACNREWDVFSLRNGQPCLHATRLSDGKTIVFSNGGQRCSRPLAAAFMQGALWVLNYEFGYAEVYVGLDAWASQEHSPEPICGAEFEEDILNARFEIVNGRSLLAVRFVTWITLYELNVVSNDKSTPLKALWTFDFSPRDGLEYRYISAFAIADAGAQLFFIDHIRHADNSSRIMTVRPHMKPGDESFISTFSEEAQVAVQGGPEDILRHMSYMQYQGGRLTVGRMTSCLWITVSLHFTSMPRDPITLDNLPRDHLHVLTMKDMKNNRNWMSEWVQKTRALQTSPTEDILYSTADDAESGDQDIITGAELIPFLFAFNAQPSGHINVPIHLACVCITSYANYAIIRANFPAGPKFFRLDCHYEEDEIHEQVVLRFWNQTRWQDCLNEGPPGSSDNSRWPLDLDALCTEEAAERERQETCVALDNQEGDSKPSLDLLNAWRRLGFTAPTMTAM